MKKSSYIFCEEINSDAYLYYNSFTNQFLLMNKEKHENFERKSPDDLLSENTTFYDILKQNGFIIDNHYDEFDVAVHNKRMKQFNSSLYNIVVNTTLDCNLNCWYCYEKKIHGSHVSDKIISAIEKNMEWEFQSQPYRVLKLSFFGGEPFLEFDTIKKLLCYAKDFCEKHNLELIADFTTNATLIKPDHIQFLKQFQCNFQITLDGYKESHNRIKNNKEKTLDSYQLTLNALKQINDNIKKHWIAVRINFDNETLRHIDDIIKDISFLNRKLCYVIVKKIWQIPTDKVNKELLFETIQKLFDNDFLVDYYVMPKGCVCFAERMREVLFNYDGKVFKCTTIYPFDDSNALGILDEEKGIVHWNENKMAKWTKDLLPEHCKKCKWFPACLGPCNRQLLVHQDEEICTFDAMNMNSMEYLIYLFKYNILMNKLYA